MSSDLSERAEKLKQILKTNQLLFGMSPREAFDVETQNVTQQVPTDAMVVVVHDRQMDCSILKLSLMRPTFKEFKIPVDSIVSIKTQWTTHTL